MINITIVISVCLCYYLSINLIVRINMTHQDNEVLKCSECLAEDNRCIACGDFKYDSAYCSSCDELVQAIIKDSKGRKVNEL